MSSDEYYSCSEGEDFPPPPTPAELAAYAVLRRRGRPCGCRAGRRIQAARGAAIARVSAASGRRTGACGNACRPPSRPPADYEAGCGVFKTKRRWPVADPLRQQPAARHTDTTSPRHLHRRVGVDLQPGRLVRSTGAGSPIQRVNVRSGTLTARRRPLAVGRLHPTQPGAPWTNWWPSTL